MRGRCSHRVEGEGSAFLLCPHPILPEGGDTSDPEIPGAPPSSPSSDVCPDPLWACLAPWPRPSPATTVVCKASLSVCGVVRTPRPLPSL